MPSIRALSSFASSLLAQIPLFSEPSTFPATTPFNLGQTPTTFEHTCPIDSPVSCHNSTVAPDSCCFIYPGGQLLQTQFWDTGPSIGPGDSWTLHGLWPDLCDGSYPTFCNQAPMYHNITAIIESSDESEEGVLGGKELLANMNKYWLPNRGTPESFWEHEWNKHGTCINTLSPSCYASYTPGAEVISFFSRAVSLFKTLDTYAALEQKGIVPAWGRRYTRTEIENALRGVTGEDVVLGCRSGRLNQVWYSFNVQGSLQTGEFLPVSPVGKSGRGGCPERGIRYLPK